MTKTYQIIINNQPLTLTLTSSPSWGYCAGCVKKQPIRVMAKHPNQLRRKFCNVCALNKVDELYNYEFENQTQIIKELRRFLLTNSLEQEPILECYA
jgi:hypothetical protein